MSYSELNATGYVYNYKNYCSEFENVLSKIYLCYNSIIKTKVVFENNENKIRDYILNYYLKNQNNKIIFKLTDYLFDKEIPENLTSGRVDIRVMPINPFICDEAYYIIECKRIDDINLYGISGLNAKYIKNGIYRFVSLKYSSFYKVNGMIAFIVKKIDIDNNIKNINELLENHFSNCNIVQYLQNTFYINNFKFQYSSIHKDINNSEFKLYHLMLDFSNNIN